MAENHSLQTLFQNFQKVTKCVQTHLSNFIQQHSVPPPLSNEQPPLLSVSPSLKKQNNSPSSPDLTHQILLKSLCL
ncbi:hypothetical protein Pint_33794 [Pistacia integerrima]|uniref:Uncharacterized protein n=1 Tax=Pistacia integerrima TaxID=434235 RepID=A0ACC0X563_9ROSI|nr:hypothetical protein Pint_33794 [Pistacia integerrima]